MSEEIIHRNQVRRLMGRAWGNIAYSLHSRRHGEANKAETVALILEYRRLRKLLKTAPPEINPRDNIVWRDEEADQRIGFCGGDRYRYDFDDKFRKEWEQFDTHQDAWYFGVWVNIKERKTFTYAEGDRTLVECPTLESFKAELADAERFYGAPPPAFICFDTNEKGQWERTEVYADRPKLEETK